MVNVILQMVVGLIGLGLWVAGYGANSYSERIIEDGDDDGRDSSVNYIFEDNTDSKLRDWKADEEPARIRRYDNKNDDREMTAVHLEDVKGALKEILSGRNVEEIFTFQSEDTTIHAHFASRSHNRPHVRIYDTTKTTDSSSTLDLTDDTTTANFNIATRSKESRVETETSYVEEVQNTEDTYLEKKPEHVTSTVDHIVRTTGIVLTYEKTRKGQPENKTNDVQFRAYILTTCSLHYGFWIGWYTSCFPVTTQSTTTLPLCYTTTSTTSTTQSPTPEPKLDIPALLDIISNFTYDWLQNLTRRVNETLQKKGIPTCSQWRNESYGENMTGTVMGKCFVCGLEDEGIPRNAHCADAFAGDFLPLLPVDPTARSQIAMYRKYCRYLNKPTSVINYSDPKAAFGRWTGGCAVRWVDLTGVYTQRTCRNRHQPVLGKHFASKRMAKLEMALQHLDDGCIISPMASLLPVSRGISLYARFHACVCSGPWCNRAIADQPCTVYIAIVSMVLTMKQTVFYR